MTSMVVQAPVSLLLDPDLSPSAKLVWLVLRAHAEHGPMSPAMLEEHTDLSRKTVLKALSELIAQGWYAAGAIDRSLAQASVPVPAEVLTDDRIRIQGRLLYGLLQLTPAFNHPRGRFICEQLSRLIHASVPTVRHAVRSLVETGWLETSQKNKRAPFRFTLCNPVASLGEAEVARAQQRIGRGGFSGETLMREYLSVLVASDRFQDNAAPGFLINPLTNALMQFDRFYPPNVAFEFNGPQHYHATQRFSEDIVAEQKYRDLMKQGYCAREAITLVVVHAEDLRLETMQKKIPHLLPLRSLGGHDQLIEFLESASRPYRQAAKNPHWLK